MPPSKKLFEITDGMMEDFMDKNPDLTSIELQNEFEKEFNKGENPLYKGRLNKVAFLKKWRLVSKARKFMEKNADQQANQYQFLRDLPYYPQRSAEWFKMRENCVTASSWGQALGFVPYKGSSPKDLIRSKVAPETMPPFDDRYTKWGVKYEEVATRMYEYKVGIRVEEFSLVVHPKYEYLGASPDGIRVDGVMLEIKCPPKREITGIPPYYYWIQMQGQLEVCDLEKCDFLECKITEFDTEEEFWLSENEMKGVVSNFVDADGKESFGYYVIPFNADGLDNWITEEQKKPNFHSLSFWQIEKYSCVPVYRDRDWFEETLPKLKEFWDLVIHHREVGLDDSFFTKKEIEERYEKERVKMTVAEIKDAIENKYGGDINAVYADPDVSQDVIQFIESGSYISNEEMSSVWN